MVERTNLHKKHWNDLLSCTLIDVIETYKDLHCVFVLIDLKDVWDCVTLTLISGLWNAKINQNMNLALWTLTEAFISVYILICYCQFISFSHLTSCFLAYLYFSQTSEIYMTAKLKVVKDTLVGCEV